MWLSKSHSAPAVQGRCSPSPDHTPRRLVQLCVLFRPVHGAKLLHVLLDVLLGLVLDVLIALKVLRILAGLQLLVHHTVG